MNRNEMFAKLMGMTDLFVIPQDWTAAMVTAGLLKANRLHGKVIVDDGHSLCWPRERSIDKAGPKRRVLLSGFSNLADHKKRLALLSRLGEYNVEIIGIYHNTQVTQRFVEGWREAMSEAGFKVYDWMIMPDRHNPTCDFGEMAFNDCKEAKLLDKNHLSEALFKVADSGNRSVCPAVDTFAECKLNSYSFGYDLGRMVENIARAKFELSKEDLEMAGGAELLISAQQIEDGVWLSSVGQQYLEIPERNIWCAQYFLEEHSGDVFIFGGSQLTHAEAKWLGGSLIAKPLVRYGFKDGARLQVDEDPTKHFVVRLVFSKPIPRAESGAELNYEQLLLSLRRAGFKVIQSLVDGTRNLAILWNGEGLPDFARNVLKIVRPFMFR